MLTIGVISDTHIPDRAREIRPKAQLVFQQANVDHILHAGDISIPRVIKELEDIAPVHAVRGNRDWFGFDDLPMTRVLHFENLTLGLTHGHGGWRKYLGDKARYIFKGPASFSVFMQRAITLLPKDVDVVVFGHNHSPINKWLEGKLIFNPGSACIQIPRELPPSVGLLHIDGKQIKAEIVYLGN